MNDPQNREETIFEAALLLRGPEREAHLKDACGDDTALRLRVERLLKSYKQARADFLENPRAGRPNGTIASPVPPPIEELPGTMIGRYKLLEKVGEGGFGMVYVAEQRDPVKRRVALKILKLGMDTRQVVARFEGERQALALMDHPNIAKVFDAGATEKGRPYFVMELVRGVRITEYCDENNLSTRERLELFTKVCQAIQHAHQKGVIHRDIKPSNILVTVNDGVPVPKVIDFGIAKATQGELTDKTVYTQLQQFIGTPAYMSPEQAEMTSLDIDTRSDIYALGVLLYELLTGRTPFDQKELLEAGLDGMRRMICEREPQRPSTRVSSLQGDDRTNTAKRHALEAPKLVHLLQGDLDWIVMKCLEKDRSRRYETANGVALDLQRHLNNEPVSACPPSATYRFQKLIHRNKFAVAATSAIMAALLTGLAVSTWMFFKEKHARQRAVIAEHKAMTEAARRQQVATFLRDMLGSVGPSVALGRDRTMLRELLDNTARRLNELGAQPEVEADLRTTLGNVYSDLGEYTNSETMLRQALELHQKQLGKEHLDIATSLHDLARALEWQGKYQEAEALFREALAMRKKLLGDEHPDVATTLACLATTTGEQGDQKRAETERLLREALAMRRKIFGNTHPDVAISLDHLGMWLWHQSNPELYPEAEALQQEALVIRRKFFGNEHPEVAWSLDHLGLALRSQGKLIEAESVTREGLVLRRKLLGNDHPDLATSLHNLASIVWKQGRLTEAETMYREELALRQKMLGNEHPRVADSLFLLGRLLSSQGRHAEAEPLIRDAITIRRKLKSNDDPEVAQNVNVLAGLLLEQGKLAEAEGLLREGVAILEKTTPDDWQTFDGRSLLGGTLLGQKKYAEAEPLLLSGYDGLKQRENRIPADSKFYLKAAIQRLVQLYENTNRPDQAALWKRKLAEFDQAAKQNRRRADSHFTTSISLDGSQADKPAGRRVAV